MLHQFVCLSCRKCARKRRNFVLCLQVCWSNRMLTTIPNPSNTDAALRWTFQSDSNIWARYDSSKTGSEVSILSWDLVVPDGISILYSGKFKITVITNVYVAIRRFRDGDKIWASNENHPLPHFSSNMINMMIWNIKPKLSTKWTAYIEVLNFGSPNPMAWFDPNLVGSDTYEVWIQARGSGSTKPPLELSIIIHTYLYYCFRSPQCHYGGANVASALQVKTVVTLFRSFKLGKLIRLPIFVCHFPSPLRNLRWNRRTTPRTTLTVSG